MLNHTFQVVPVAIKTNKLITTPGVYIAIAKTLKVPHDLILYVLIIYGTHSKSPTMAAIQLIIVKYVEYTGSHKPKNNPGKNEAGIENIIINKKIKYIPTWIKCYFTVIFVLLY